MILTLIFTTQSFTTRNTPMHIEQKLSDQVSRKFIEQFDASDWEILTDTGYHPIISSNKTVEYEVYELVLSNGYSLKCADTHIVFTDNYQEIFVQDLVKDQIVQTDDGEVSVVSVTNLGYSENMYDLSIDSMDHRFYSNGILSHNSTVMAAYIAWYSIFNKEKKTSCIMANKLSTAKEIFGRVQFIIEHSPLWMQKGVKDWSKTSLKFENDTVIFCAATSPSAIRGQSINCLLLDEFAFLSQTLADEFMASVFPTISSSESSKMVIVTTPKGMNHFYKIWQDAKNGLNGFNTLEATWKDHPYRTQEWADEQLAQLGELKYNQEVLCEFAGSSLTLISGHKFSSIPFLPGVLKFDSFTEYHKPETNHSYIIVADVARGAELDYSAFIVIDVTHQPYRVSAVFRDNKIDPQMYPVIIHRVAHAYNDAFVLVETNDIGQQVADILFYDIEYENCYMSNREKINEGQGKKIPGLRTTKKTKALGCSNLKTLVENDMLVINDAKIIEEMSVFVRVGSTYKAEEGKTDDLMMCLVMFGYLSAQPVFQELFDYNLRAVYLKNQQKEWDDQMEPIGFIDRGEVIPQISYDRPYVESKDSWADFVQI
jgi:hypothetical protein